MAEEKLIRAFSMLAELELHRHSDRAILRKLARLLENEDPLALFSSQKGAWVWAALKHFGLCKPFSVEGQRRLDKLCPRLVCRTFVAKHKFDRQVMELAQAKEIFTQADFQYEDRPPMQRV